VFVVQADKGLNPTCYYPRHPNLLYQFLAAVGLILRLIGRRSDQQHVKRARLTV